MMCEMRKIEKKGNIVEFHVEFYAKMRKMENKKTKIIKSDNHNSPLSMEEIETSLQELHP